MKKVRFMFILSALMMAAVAAKALATSSYRVLDYTYNCVGCGGNCLPTIIVTPPKA